MKNRMYKTIGNRFAFWLSCLICCQAFGQQTLKFDHLDIQDGLSQNSILSIAQDQKGFIWFGTEEGLNKYDGYQFRSYTSDSNNPNSLSDSYIQDIHVDKRGMIWIGTASGGLNRFDPVNEQFIRYRYQADDESTISQNNVRTIFSDHHGILWVGTDNRGLNRFDPATEKFTRIYLDSTDAPGPCNSILSINEDKKGRIWLGTNGCGLFLFSPTEMQVVEAVDGEEQIDRLSGATVHTIFRDRSDVLWLGTNNGGLHRYNQNTGKMTRFAPNMERFPDWQAADIARISQDHEGELWLGTLRNGLFRFNPRNGKYAYFRHNPLNNKSLSDDEVRSLFHDRSGSIWIGTFAGGVNKYNKWRNKFIHYAVDHANPFSLSNNHIMAIYESDDRIVWLGTDGGGLNLFDPVRERFTAFRHSPIVNTSISDDRVWAITAGKNETLWIGTRAGIDLLDKTTASFKRYTTSETGETLNFIRTFFRDSKDVLWVGTWQEGLFRYNESSDGFRKIPRYLSTDDPSVADRIYTIEEDVRNNQGNLWIGYWEKGLAYYDRKTGEFTSFYHDPDNPKSLGNDRVLTIHTDKNSNGNILWIGTYGGGLNKFNVAEDKFTRYTVSNGLPNDVVYGIVEDDFGYLWLSTNRGIAKFNPETENCANFDVDDGLQSNEFNGGAYFKGYSGEIYFGGVYGLNRFFPENINPNPHVPPVVLTDFKIFEKPAINRLGKEISEVDSITLTQADAFFSFEFAALDYAFPQKNQYAYKMEGFEKDWLFPEGRRYASYTNLDPGEYTFKVRGSNNDQTWNQNGLAVHITILPQFWQTAWFRILGGVLALLFIYIIVKSRVRAIEQNRRHLEQEVTRRTAELEHITEELRLHEEELLENAEELRKKSEALEKANRMAQEANKAKSLFLAMVSHEIRTPINGVIGMNDLMLETKLSNEQHDYAETIKQSAESLLSIINDILDFSKMEAGKLDIESIKFSLEEIINAAANIVTPKIRKKNLSLGIEIDPEIPDMLIGDPVRIRQILFNFISNAVKFTASGGVKLIAKLEGRDEDKVILKLSVKDSGIGIPIEKQAQIFDSFSQVDASTTRKYGGTGLGLAISKQLAELMGGEIGLESEIGKGSTFWFTTVCQADVLEELLPSVKRVVPKVVSNGQKPLVPNGNSENGSTVLVAEDNVINQKLIRRLLEKNSYQVDVAENGRDAIDAFKNKKYDLVLMDIQMPEMDGLEATRIIREMEEDEGMDPTPIVALTANAMKGDRELCLTAGMDSYISKPIRKKELFETITKLMEAAD